MKVTIELEEDQPLKIFADGEQVPLIKEAVLVAHTDAPPVLSVRFNELRTLRAEASSDEERRAMAKVVALLIEVKDKLRQSSYVEVLGPHDTLPSGMAAVKDWEDEGL